MGTSAQIYLQVCVTKKDYLYKPTAHLIVLISQISHNPRVSLNMENNFTIAL